MTVVDAFAGIGWAMGLRSLGIDEVGVEHNADVCALRAGLGLRTIRADVAAMPVDHLRGKVAGAIFSPPCQSFSAAGKRKGLDDPRGLLVREPLRWVEAMRPCWVACEQVPDVLPYWRAVADRLRPLGYSTWTGILDTADYGVPQNRTRAFLMASIDVDVTPPEPTHSRTGHAEMFGGGRQRWVSMAEALGWGMDDRPSRAVCGERGPRWAYEDRDGTHGRMVVDVGQDSKMGGGRTERYTRAVERPSPTVDGNAGTRWKLRSPWAWERPSTTVQADVRIARPGHTGTPEKPWQFANAIPVELWELGVLQGFPPDFPWHLAGTKTAQATVIGNAVPPPMAAAIVGALTGAERTVAA